MKVYHHKPVYLISSFGLTGTAVSFALYFVYIFTTSEVRLMNDQLVGLWEMKY